MFQSYYDRYLEQFAFTLRAMDFELVDRIMTELEKARANGRQLFVIGNGGSASSASHWACDFGKGVNVEGVERFRVINLTDNMAWITALGNDISYGDIFAEQLKNNALQAGDVVVGLSVSGDSENVVKALRYAGQKGAMTVAIVGAKGGRLKELADLALVVPSTDYGMVEDAHMMINHVISQYLRSRYEEKVTRAR